MKEQGSYAIDLSPLSMETLAIWCLPPESSLTYSLRAFYQAACVYYPEETSVEDVLKALQGGLAFLQTAKLWWIENCSKEI